MRSCGVVTEDLSLPIRDLCVSNKIYKAQLAFIGHTGPVIILKVHILYNYNLYVIYPVTSNGFVKNISVPSFRK